MRVTLTEEDCELIAKALERMVIVAYQKSPSSELAVKQRANQVIKKLRINKEIA